ncbi:MAG: hypothetical protein JNL98_17095 [Bryobacterales bacterium]|nr:hypothetical protein [Bryobacterales bacterium]
MPTTEIQIRLSRTAFTEIEKVTVDLGGGKTITFEPGKPSGEDVFSTRTEKIASGKYCVVMSVPDAGPGDFPGPNDPPEPPPSGGGEGGDGGEEG